MDTHRAEDCFGTVPHQLTVVREDSGQVLGVSDRYTLVPRQRILNLVRETVAPLHVGAVPQGIYVDCCGARMRTVFKLPALARPAIGNDQICPCLKMQNTHRGRSRIAVHIGAFRFVCTNLAVGGTGLSPQDSRRCTPARFPWRRPQGYRPRRGEY